ncbi:MULTISPECIES: hypothetical protein [Vibrio]|nr:MULTISPECIES: hypothetical protein [Vibrio]MBU2899128.1 hypothetical protein [Vibrio hepatarius]
MITNQYFALVTNSKRPQKSSNQGSDSPKEQERKALVKEAQKQGGF